MAGMASEHTVGPLVVHEYGNPTGPVLLVLHGLTDSGRCWVDLVERLGSTYRIVAPDALGHGASARFTPAELASPDPAEVMYAATEDVLRAVAPEGGALVLGHSMGGGMAAALTVRCPDLVRGVVLEDPTWLDEPRRDPEDGLRQHLADVRLVAEDPEAALRQGRADHPTWPESELEPWVQAKTDVDTAFLGTGRAVLDVSWREIAAALRRPTLLVTGDADVIVTDEVVAEIVALGNPEIEVRVVAGAGHCVRREARAGFHHLVDPWLADAVAERVV